PPCANASARAARLCFLTLHRIADADSSSARRPKVHAGFYCPIQLALASGRAILGPLTEARRHSPVPFIVMTRIVRVLQQLAEKLRSKPVLGRARTYSCR